MSCPSDVNSGFIQLVGPISQQDLTSITVKNYPLSISFAPRSIVPSLVGNRIDESTENTCTYKGSRFSLADVQICSVTNKGYTLPGITTQPVAELALSFSANTAPTDLLGLSGIIMFVPIYDSGTPSHHEYLTQLVDPSISSCNYTNEPGSTYTGGDYQELPNLSLSSCVKSCCGDPNCLAYTYQSGQCSLKNSIPTISKTADMNIISGTIDRNKPLKCDESKPSKTLKDSISTLESIFYAWDGDHTQTSFAYKTCFETVSEANDLSSKSLSILIFPNGIHLSASTYQQLLLQIGGTLKTYRIPPVIRGGDATIRTYQLDDQGNKIPLTTSRQGIVYSTTPFSSCTDEFKYRFEYFTLPPKVSNRKLAGIKSDTCPYYQTTQYRCAPFNQSTDLSGNYVIPGNKSLQTILKEEKTIKDNLDSSNKDINSDFITIAASVVILVGGVGGLLYVINNIASD